MNHPMRASLWLGAWLLLPAAAGAHPDDPHDHAHEDPVWQKFLGEECARGNAQACNKDAKKIVDKTDKLADRIVTVTLPPKKKPKEPPPPELKLPQDAVVIPKDQQAPVDGARGARGAAGAAKGYMDALPKDHAGGFSPGGIGRLKGKASDDLINAVNASVSGSTQGDDRNAWRDGYAAFDFGNMTRTGSGTVYAGPGGFTVFKDADPVKALPAGTAAPSPRPAGKTP